MRLSIYLLGDFQVSVDNQSITRKFRTDKERALLAYLAIEGKRPISRETLAELLWPDRPEGMSRANLRQALLGVRNAIEDKHTPQPFLLVSDESIQINRKASYWLDVDAFSTRLQFSSEHPHQALETCPTCTEQLQEAIDLFRQDFLTGLYVENSQVFQEWAFFHREQYKRFFLEILDRLSEIHKLQGDWDTMQKYAWLYVKHAPLEEQAYRRLMELLALSGRRTAALEQYQICVRLLEQELGVEPSPETVSLYERIRKGRPIGAADDLEIQTHGGLPRAMTEFIGRENELETLAHCFANPSCQLISLSGLPGVGKSRLAVEAIQRNNQAFPDGVYYLSFEGVHSDELFFPTLARSLGLTISLSNAKLQLARYLETKRCILFIDQFDEMHGSTHHLMDLLQNAYQLKILVTSRQQLDLLAAYQLQLDGLPYPQDPNDSLAIQSPAVQLFIKRARRSRQEFAQDPTWLYQILDLCHTVDGVPLALELAADRLRELPLPTIIDALQRNLAVLSTSLQDIPARQRSLEKAIGAAWEKLEDVTQKQLLALSIFPRSFSAQAAQEICNCSSDVLSFLADQSLLQRSGDGRFCMRPLIHQFARERLSEQAERKSALQMLYGNYYLDFLRQKAAQLAASPLSSQSPAPIHAEIENIYHALDWAVWVGESDLMRQAVGDLQRCLQAWEALPAYRLEGAGATRNGVAAKPGTLLGPQAEPHGFCNQQCYRLPFANNAMLMTGPDGQIYAANYQALQLRGLTLGGLLELDLDDLGLDDCQETWLEPIVHEAQFRHNSGAAIPVEVLIAPARQGEEACRLFYIKKKLVEPQSDPGAAAQADPLTGLPEQKAFGRQLRKTISGASTRLEQFAVLVLQLEGLPQVQEQFGEEATRQVLQQAAWRIRSSLRERDFLAYLGGGEFGLILEKLPHPKAVDIVATKLGAQFQTPFHNGEQEVPIRLLFGAGLYPHDADHAEALLKFARQAVKV